MRAPRRDEFCWRDDSETTDRLLGPGPMLRRRHLLTLVDNGLQSARSMMMTIINQHTSTNNFYSAKTAGGL